MVRKSWKKEYDELAEVHAKMVEDNKVESQRKYNKYVIMATDKDEEIKRLKECVKTLISYI